MKQDTKFTTTITVEVFIMKYHSFPQT